MVKITVLYNLPPGTDPDEFLEWRTTRHQADNAAMPGVVRTDFYHARPSPLGEPLYRFITEVFFASMEDLEASFFTPEAQAKLKKDLEWTHEPVFLISEEVIASADLAALS